MLFMALLYLLAKSFRFELRTTAGRDWQARVMGDPDSDASGVYAPATYIGVSANTNAPSAANTTLPGEISVGTLARAQAAYAHTNGQDSYTLTKVFTSDQPVTLAKAGVFNASSSGTLVFEGLLEEVATMVSGDQIQITVTVTLD